jgi:hypothetical protein
MRRDGAATRGNTLPARFDRPCPVLPKRGTSALRERESDRTPRAGAVWARSSCARCGWRFVWVTRSDVTSVAAEAIHAFFLCQQLCAFFFGSANAALAPRWTDSTRARRRAVHRSRTECIKQGDSARCRKAASADHCLRATSRRDRRRRCDALVEATKNARNRRLVRRTNQNCANFFRLGCDFEHLERAFEHPKRRRPHLPERPSSVDRCPPSRGVGDWLRRRALRRSRRRRAGRRAGRRRWRR